MRKIKRARVRERTALVRTQLKIGTGKGNEMKVSEKSAIDTRIQVHTKQQFTEILRIRALSTRLSSNPFFSCFISLVFADLDSFILPVWKKSQRKSFWIGSHLVIFKVTLFSCDFASKSTDGRSIGAIAIQLSYLFICIDWMENLMDSHSIF